MAVRELEEEEGGYFASVSDLMVGILFVFLLVLTVFALNYRQAEKDQTIERSRYEEAQRQAERAKQEAIKARELARQQELRADQLRDFLAAKSEELQRAIDASTSARNRLLATLETTLAQRGVKVWVDAQAGILHLPGDLLFATNSASLSAKQRENVDILADALAQALPCYTPIEDRSGCDTTDLPILETVLIEGHTDRRPISPGGAFRDNDQLSTERALAVFAEIRNRQDRLERLLNADATYPLLGVSGFGQRRPLPDPQPDSGAAYAQNRRIDLRFLLARSAELERLKGEIDKALGDSAK